VLVVAYATAAARQVRFPILRAIRDAGPTSPHEMVENIGDIGLSIGTPPGLNWTVLLRKSSLSLYSFPYGDGSYKLFVPPSNITPSDNLGGGTYSICISSCQ
jgi:hypothetical protein